MERAGDSLQWGGGGVLGPAQTWSGVLILEKLQNV